jgi:hypothetical protein
LKWRRILQAGFRCERCGRHYEGRHVRTTVMRWFQLHHLHYRTVGDERFEDVLVLCRLCHELEHDLIPEALES